MKNIVCDLSVESVEKAVQELKEYRFSFQNRWRRAMQGLAQESAKHLQNAGFFNSIVAIYELTDNGFILTAEGEQIGFIEFGAGAYSDEQHPLREEAPFPVFSGSYSDTVGAGTWHWWVAVKGNPEETYPYNRVPLRPLYQTSVWIRDNARRIIRWYMDGNND